MLVVHVGGTLAKSDHEQFVPEFERLAIIGEKKWQHSMAMFCQPFTAATIRYFDHAGAAEARKWLGEAPPLRP
jgi:hypothetical protein